MRPAAATGGGAGWGVDERAAWDAAFEHLQPEEIEELTG